MFTNLLIVVAVGLFAPLARDRPDDPAHARAQAGLVIENAYNNPGDA